MAKKDVLGAPIDDLSMQGVLDRIDTAVRQKERLQVATLNAEILYRALSEPDLMAAIRSCGLVTPDGTGVVWAAKRLGHGALERVTGIDLLSRLLQLAPERNYRLYFYGAKPQVLAAALANVERDHPNIQIVGSTHGYIATQAEQDALLDDIRRSEPDILFVALGAPRQEFWIRDHLPILPPLVAIGVGGSLDVLSGTLKRAPRLVQALRLEWLYRAIIQPSRFSRLAVLPRFVWRVLKAKARA